VIDEQCNAANPWIALPSEAGMRGARRGETDMNEREPAPFEVTQARGAL